MLQTPFAAAVLLCFLSVDTFEPAACQQSSPIVRTRNGFVEGNLVNLAPTMPVYEFTGIPYAEAPLNGRRFKKTVQKRPWKGIFKAKERPKACPQEYNQVLANYTESKGLYSPHEQSEDCLFVNIWAPKSVIDMLTTSVDEPPRTLPVLVFIHGGNFHSGSMSVYNGSVLAAYNNIVVATFQYRLGSLGFAYLGTDQVPGNMGLWDQVEALRWLCQNIGSFGGNCSETTIAGEGAGAVSVTLHLLSRQSRRYFRRAIIQSGSALAAWAVHTADAARLITNYLFHQNLNRACPLDSIDASSSNASTINCLHSVDASLFPTYDNQLWSRGFGWPFVPVIDGVFLLRSPAEMLADGDFYKIPLLIGSNKDEGSVYLMTNSKASKILPFSGNTKRAMAGFNLTHYNALLEAAFVAVKTNPLQENPLLQTAVALQYWPISSRNGYPMGSEVAVATITALGDYLISCPTYGWLQTASELREMKQQTYAYYFTQFRPMRAWPAWAGVMQGDELPYIFGAPLMATQNWLYNRVYSKDDKIFSRVMMSYWTNFVKYGNPNDRDISAKNIKYGPLQQRPWPVYRGRHCPSRIIHLNVLSQVYNYGPGLYCGLKARNCLFWDNFVPQLSYAHRTF